MNIRRTTKQKQQKEGKKRKKKEICRLSFKSKRRYKNKNIGPTENLMNLKVCVNANIFCHFLEMLGL